MHKGGQTRAQGKVLPQCGVLLWAARIVFLFGEVNPAWVQCLPWSLNSLLLPAMLPKFQQSERTELFCPISQRKPRLVVASSLLLLGLPWLLAPKES